MKKVIKQSRQKYRWQNRGQDYEVYSISREEIPLTSKYVKVQDISELNQGDIYYWKGLNGRLGHSLQFDIHDSFINYQTYKKVLNRQIERGIIYILKPIEEKKPKLRRGQISSVGTQEMF
jgi:hypothetical protein